MTRWTCLALLALSLGASRARAQDADDLPQPSEPTDLEAPVVADGDDLPEASEPPDLDMPVAADADAPPPPLGSALDPESYVALSADDQAQLGLGGFRRYLERIRPTDAALYVALDPALDDLEWRDGAADVTFGVATGLAVAALVAAIPVYTELGEGTGGDIAIALAAAGAGTFVLGLVIQAIVRPGHADLLRLIDRHDEAVGRR